MRIWAAKVGCVPGGPPGLGSPSWRILGSAPQAELGAKQSTERLMCTLCRNKHRKSVGGLISCASGGVDMSAHVPTFDTCALTRLGSQALVRMISRPTRLPLHIVHSSRGRELGAGWTGSRGFPWIGSRG